MALTARSVILVALGVIPAVLRPTSAMVWLWVLGCLVIIGVDLALAPSPTRVSFTRRPPAAVRLGESTHTTLVVSNESSRRVRGLLRDAWPPSAGAAPQRHTLDLPPGERTRVTTILPSACIVTLWPASVAPLPKSVTTFPPSTTGAKVGASFTAVTVMLAVSLALLKAPVPGVVTTYCPALPLVMSQARKLMASLSVPFRSP